MESMDLNVVISQYLSRFQSIINLLVTYCNYSIGDENPQGMERDQEQQPYNRIGFRSGLTDTDYI